MFRWASTILLLTLISLQIAGKWLILADYALNKAYIARTLCVNKNKPSMHCNGRCHLRKQLQKEENGGDQTTNNISHQKFQEVFFETTSPISFAAIPATTTTNVIHNTALYTNSYIASIFHPPGNV